MVDLCGNNYLVDVNHGHVEVLRDVHPFPVDDAAAVPYGDAGWPLTSRIPPPRPLAGPNELLHKRLW